MLDKANAKDISNPSSGSEQFMRILIRYTENFCNHTNILYPGWQHRVPRHPKPPCILQWRSSQHIKKPGILTLTHWEVGSRPLHGLCSALPLSKICEYLYPGVVLSKALESNAALTPKKGYELIQEQCVWSLPICYQSGQDCLQTCRTKGIKGMDRYPMYLSTEMIYMVYFNYFIHSYQICPSTR